MGERKVKEFVKLLEDEFGKGLYRRIKVIRNEDGSKRPIWDMNTMAKEDILNKQYEYKPKSKPPYKADGRGYKDTDEWTDYSLFIKHIPDLYCIDFDTHKVENKSLYNLLMEQDTYFTKTKKGYHFYVMVYDMPKYTNEIDVALTEEEGGEWESPKDIDFIKFQKNIWENKSRSVYGSNFTRISHQDLSANLNFYEMNVDGAKDKKTKKLKVDDEDVKVEDEEFKCEIVKDKIDTKVIKGYLKRLNDRYNYKNWINIGFILYTNYDGDDDGFNIWREWTLLDNDIKKRNQGRKLTFMVKKWESMNNEVSSLTWKSLRMWANEDTPQNQFEQSFKEGGEKGLTMYMNKFCMYNDATSEYLFELRDNRGTWVLKKASQMKDKLGKFKFFLEVGEDGGKKTKVKVNPFEVWNENLYRRDINRIVFDPSCKEKNVFNLWRGYKISKEDAEKFDELLAKPVLDHIKMIWCKGNEELYKYTMSWFAWVLQRPHIKIAVLLALKSDEGAGKGVVMELVKAIMGTHFSETSESGNILGDFNSGLEAKVLIDLDEAFWGGDKKIEGKLKHLITQTEVSINKKCKEPYEIENTTAFMITTNNDRFLPADKGARRFLCLELDGKYAGVETAETKAYFDAVRSVPAGAFAKVLYNWDISDFRPRSVPRTELLQDQIERGWNTTTKWWFSVLKDGYFSYKTDIGKDLKLKWGDIDYYRENGRKVVEIIKTKNLDKPDMEYVLDEEGKYMKDDDGSPIQQQKRDENGELVYKYDTYESVRETGYHKEWLYGRYKTADVGWGSKVEPNIFGKELKNLMGKYYVNRRISDKKAKGGRIELIVIPSLRDMRAEFCKIQNWNYDWEEDSGGADYLDEDGNVKKGFKMLVDGSSDSE